jgi:SAM-dependent methyltransferase
MAHQHDWDRRYEGTDRLFSTEPDQALVDLAGSLRPGRALDLGAGEGRNSLWLARRGWRVTAVDLSGVALSRLAQDAAAEGLVIDIVAGDMGEYLARGARFDLVVVANLHPSAVERARLLAAAAEAVAPGGHLFLVGHHLDSLGRAGPPDPERLYTESRLVGAFPGLELLRLERLERRRGDLDTSLVDVVAWATRPARVGSDDGEP